MGKLLEHFRFESGLTEPREPGLKKHTLSCSSAQPLRHPVIAKSAHYLTEMDSLHG